MDIPERKSSNSSALLDQQEVESSLKIYREVYAIMKGPETQILFLPRHSRAITQRLPAFFFFFFCSH